LQNIFLFIYLLSILTLALQLQSQELLKNKFKEKFVCLSFSVVVTLISIWAQLKQTSTLRKSEVSRFKRKRGEKLCKRFAFLYFLYFMKLLEISEFYDFVLNFGNLSFDFYTEGISWQKTNHISNEAEMFLLENILMSVKLKYFECFSSNQISKRYVIRTFELYLNRKSTRKF